MILPIDIGIYLLTEWFDIENYIVSQIIIIKFEAEILKKLTH